MIKAIETDRCLLNPAAQEDNNEVYELYSNEDSRRFLGGVVDKTSFNQCYIDLLQDIDSLNWVVRLKKGDEFIGMTSISKHHNGQDIEISYQFLPQFWGRGLASETVAAVILYAANEMDLPYVVAETQSANVLSKNLLEKLGMKPVEKVVRFGAEQVIYRKDFDRPYGDLA